jgi:hypothetical protein
MHKIEYYEFGKIVVDGHEYTNDLIIYPDKIDASWWRKEGHLLQIDDIREILSTTPDILIIGDGHDERMRVTSEVKKELDKNNIQYYIEDSKTATEIYNEKVQSEKEKKVVGAFHLTC